MKNFKKFVVENKYFFVSAIIIYILILIPSLKIPFQSDDYSYFLQGISLQAKWKHYIGWSGRVITDFTSSFLLGYLPYVIYEAINSLAFIVMLIFVSLLPSTILNKDKNKLKVSSLTLWFVFLIYWISNPNLGQTSFWIVGSANYLWTIMWASIYLFILFYYLKLKEELGKVKLLLYKN